MGSIEIYRWLCTYYTHRDGSTTIQLRHQIKAALAVINILIIGILIMILVSSIPILRAFDLAEQTNAFYSILLLIIDVILASLVVWFLGKIRNIYIFSIISLSLWGVFCYVVGLVDMLIK